MRSLRLPDQVPQGFGVWQLDLDLDADVSNDDWSLLAADERSRASRLRRHEDRARAVSTRASLRRLLGAHLDASPESLQFDVGPHGKPTLRVRAASSERDTVQATLRFNVSHAGEHALIVVARGCEVGIDLERDDPALVDPALQAQVLSPSEQARASQHDLGFHQRWVVKEAALKALGIGITEHLRSLSVLPPASRVQCDILFSLQHAQAWPALHALQLAAPPGYVAALAWFAEDSKS